MVLCFLDVFDAGVATRAGDDAHRVGATWEG